ncbi:hypothetical protein GUITHDRAFT_109768 [Guillardia theta CCMP2712]|uniref:RING-type domain-containing protein n=1 Tax=Guillardia theta (strain CCMP2712) TaxID=905079 RepID=L1J897_GUITC|nr:hypothetical protein GUITHDRAFT_109768 [Guillardia theta CCMP2712]EKX44314.1 hypothetical protein GUITHDRAFT_109768 [Guillardia theta CCMP2712]|eukprot:XP_005831294.1 hypothetical protein GUITHDRAFT_109768 [Guillardia theta CCMP2712]
MTGLHPANAQQHELPHLQEATRTALYNPHPGSAASASRDNYDGKHFPVLFSPPSSVPDVCPVCLEKNSPAYLRYPCGHHVCHSCFSPKDNSTIKPLDLFTFDQDYFRVWPLTSRDTTL